MGRNKFTEEEISFLSKSEHVLKVTESQLIFTEKFKSFCVEQRNNGMTAKQIFDIAGIGFHLIGKRRAYNNIDRFVLQSEREEGFKRLSGAGRKNSIEFESLEEELQYYKDKAEYLKQENDFLKKLDALEQKYK